MKLAVCLLAAPVAGLVAPAAPKAETRLHSSDYAKTLYGVGPRRATGTRWRWRTWAPR